MRRPRGDRGSTELVVATPLLLILLLLVVQAGLAAHASQTAQAIAATALAATRAADAGEAGGRAAAEQATAQLSGDLLSGVDITVERTGTTARVEVAAQIPSVLPGPTWPIRHETSAPVE
ncbi:MAG TPA: TadE/TadG family type IV pilus assembly protein, partial [Thermobifida alba]|nr:TadE/TadG family type IV pilus assembly protein [Thermobifida alba]